MSSEATRRPLVSKTLQAHLSHLEITDFKSYSGVHKLGPLKKGLNCIVGPNGSGKSNLMEAICWVLGVDTRHLRGLRASDLAYRKEGDPIDRTRKPEVKLTLHVESPDHKLSEDKVFTRRIDNGRNLFLLDGSLVEKEAYFKALSTYGVLPKVQNCIISQGQVESLSLKSEKEKGILFDEVSGSALLKPKYDELKDKMRDMDVELKKLHDRVKRKEQERKGFERQAKELEEFEEAEKEIQELVVKMYLLRLYVNEAAASSVGKELEGITAEEERLQQQLQAARTKVDTLLATRRQLAASVEAKRVEKDTKEAEITRKKRDADLLSKKMTVIKNQLDEVTSKQASCQSDFDALYEKYTGCAKALLEATEKRDREIAKIESLVSRNDYHKANDEDKEEFERLNAESHSKTIKYRIDITNLESKKRRLQEDLESTTRTMNELKDIIKAHTQELKLEKGKLKVLSASTIHKEESDMQRQRELLLQRHKEKSIELSAIHGRQQAAQSELDRFAYAKREDQRVVRFHDTVKTMRLKFPGIHGTLSSLCELNNQSYSTAVSTAMGLQADSLVCDTFKTAQDAIRYLKSERLPPMEFLPLDRLKINEDQVVRLAQYPGLFTPLLNCISFDAEYRKAFVQVLESVVAVDDLPAARNLAYKESKRLRLTLKIVTLDGQKILKNGNMQLSGGGGDRRQMNRFEGRQKEKLLKIAQETEEARRSLAAELEALDEQLQDIDKRLQSYETQRHEMERTVRLLTTSIQKHEEGLRQLADPSTLERQVDELSAEIDQTQQAKESGEAKIFAIEREILGVPKLRKLHKAKQELQSLEEKHQAILEAYTVASDACGRTINDLLRSLGSTADFSNTSLQDRMVSLEQELTEPSILKQLQDEEQMLSAKLSDFQSSLNSINASLRSDQSALRELDEVVADAKRQSDDITSQVAASRKKAEQVELKTYEMGLKKSMLDESLRLYDTEATDIINEITSRNIKIPTKNGTLEELIKVWKAASIDTMDEGSGVDVDFSLLPPEWISASGLRNHQAIEADIREDIDKKKALLSQVRPNFKARQQLEEVKESHQQLKRLQRETGLARQRLDDEFSKCRESRAEKFKRCFEKTRTALERVYSELTKGTEDYSTSDIDASMIQLYRKHFAEIPGGIAKLELIEEPKTQVFESGIAFYAMPPGKRFTEMDALSGGEKSMATLALLFALQSYRPSPFVVLDEVDAALDLTNVQSLRNWLKKATFQVIIVTLKDEMYCHADAIIGVYKDHEKESSGTLSLDVTAYK